MSNIKNKETENFSVEELKISDENVRYAVLMETNAEENESWYNFIRWEGNEESLKYLQEQLSKVEWYIIEDTDLSTFDLDLDHLVSEQTAREMCKLDINPFMYHRKFNGSLKKIHLKLHNYYENEDKIERVNKLIGYGGIDKFVDGEEILHSDSEYCSDSNSDEDSYNDSDSDRHD
jgi:hypothetical protein